jgi:predicted ATP-dependent protease
LDKYKTVTVKYGEHPFLEELYMIGRHFQYASKRVMGWKVGQVKGISYLDRGGSHLKRPSRIIAKVGAGRAGVIDIDFESRAVRPIHHSGIYILTDYLKAKFAGCKRIGISARIISEQPSGIITADSASSAELYALLSRISRLPIRQDIAATGLVNRKGEVQVNDAINYKIESFFDICIKEGLTGLQGMLIPQAAVANMILRKDVLQAIENHSFHLIPVHTVTEGIQIFSEVAVGEKDASGKYPAGSINYLVDRRLQKLTI